MTTRKKLSEILAADKPIQERWHRNPAVWENMLEDDNSFDIGTRDYRLKPVTTYYRVFFVEGYSAIVDNSSKPFPDFNDWVKSKNQPQNIYVHIHDFEKEES